MLAKYLYGAIAAALLSVAAYVVWQRAEIGDLEVKVEILRADLAKTVAANATCQRSVIEISRELDRNGVTCQVRLKVKDSTIRHLQDIIAAGGGCNATVSRPEQPRVDFVNGGTNIPLLNILDGMLPGELQEGSSRDGIRPGESFPSSAGAEVPSGVVVYCVDEMNAKALASNIIVLRAWSLDMQSILASYQTGT